MTRLGSILASAVFTHCELALEGNSEKSCRQKLQVAKSEVVTLRVLEI